VEVVPEDHGIIVIVSPTLFQFRGQSVILQLTEKDVLPIADRAFSAKRIR
jgi:hypothetical protein